MTKPYIVLTLLLFAIVPNLLLAQTWKALGKDEVNTPGLELSTYNSISVSPDGVPYIAFYEGTKDSITVKKFDGTKWVQVGRTLVAGYYPKITFDNNGIPYLTHMLPGPSGVVRKLIGDNWVRMGNETGVYPALAFAPDNTLYLKFTLPYSEGFRIRKFTNGFVSAGDVDNVSGGAALGEIAMSKNGTLFTAYAAPLNQNRVSAKKLVAGKWEQIGKDGFSNTRAADVKLVVSSAGTPYVAYCDSTANGAVVVQKFSNNAWAVVSPPDLSKGEARYISFAIGTDDLPYLAFRDGGDKNRATVKKLNSNGQWSAIGSSTLITGEARFTDITIAKNGTPYLIYQDNNYGGKAVVKMFSSGKWIDVGMGDISVQGSKNVVIKTNKNGKIFAAYTDDLNSGKLSVKEYISGEWKYFGSPTLSVAGVVRSELDMDLGPDGLPYVLYQDSSKFSCVVKKYNGTSWIQLGSDISPYSGAQFKIAIAPDGTVYVAFADGGYGKRFTVKKYSNSNWQFVGEGDVADASLSSLNLVVDKNNVPYIAFIDNITSKANVKRFNGTSWEYLGSKNFTEPASDISLLITPDGMPYLAYSNKNTNRIQVDAFANDSWKTAGTTSNSLKREFFPKLFYNPLGELHLAFTEADGSISYSAQIRKLDKGQWIAVNSEQMLPLRTYVHSVAFAQNGDIIYGYLNSQVFVRTNSSDDQKANPVINSISPAVGAKGTQVAIRGFNLTNATDVKIGQVKASSFKVISPTLINAVVGNGGSGNVSVTTPNGSTSIEKFEYLAGPPIIQSFSPHAGDVSSSVTIKGKNFSPSSQQNIVYFGAVAGQVLSANDSTLTVKVPVNATSSIITVTTKQRTAYAANMFIVTFKSSNSFTATTFSNKTGIGKKSLSPIAIDIKDMDGDGQADILVNDAIFVNQSSKDGFSFATQTETDMTSYGVEAEDLDGDGKPDLLLPTGPVGILKNTSTPGSITFMPNKQYVQQPYYSFTTATGDIDGDGQPDFLSMANAGLQFALYRNAGTGSGYSYFEEPFIFEIENQFSGAAIADVDGDGKADIAVIMQTYTASGPKGYLAVFRNTSNGNQVSFERTNLSQNLLAGDGATKPIIADIDNDGKPDVIVINQNANTISVFRNTSGVNDVKFAEAINIATAKKPYAICTADLDGDGFLDLATANIGEANKKAISVFKNTSSNGLINFDQRIDYDSDFQPGSIAAADLDGDQAPELVVTNYIGDNVTIFKNNIKQSSLPNDNFLISAISATCKGTSNGAISITATQKFSYTAKLTAKNVNQELKFDNTAKFKDLAAGTYRVCISSAEQPDREQCYDILISEPKDLVVFSTVNEKYKTVSLELDGGSAYTIDLNGSIYTTRNRAIELPLNSGNNRIMVTTDRDCQGLFEKTINLSGIVSPYPVPFRDILNVNVGTALVKKVSIALYDATDGKLVYQKNFDNQTGVIQLEVSNLKTSVYALYLTIDGVKKIFKVTK
ncbi:FG-GAP-like repeat-containing protein [Mucilaginibacter conchicola]|nr:FG-GAP-like repeat-containing protein [Mucilaginibacter conchicola]